MSSKFAHLTHEECRAALEKAAASLEQVPVFVEKFAAVEKSAAAEKSARNDAVQQLIGVLLDRNILDGSEKAAIEKRLVESPLSIYALARKLAAMASVTGTGAASSEKLASAGPAGVDAFVAICYPETAGRRASGQVD